MANKGTLFLDEIGDLDLKIQVKLLRVLDGVPYYRLGGSKKVSVDVRVVAATNQHLEDLVKPDASAVTSFIGWPNSSLKSRHCVSVLKTWWESPNRCCTSTILSHVSAATP